MDVSESRRIVRIVSFVVIIYGGIIAYFFGVRKFPVIPLNLPISYAAGSVRFLEKAYGIHFFEDWIMDFAPLSWALPILMTFFICWVLFGGFWCGWTCPLGLFQDGLSFLRKSAKLKSHKLSKKLEVFFDYFRYAWLIFIILLTFMISDYFVNEIGIPLVRDLHGKVSVSKTSCPGTVLYFSRGDFEEAFKRLTSPPQPIKLGTYFVGLVFLMFYFGGFFIDRFYCRVCPTGAINFLFNEGSFLAIEKDVQRCTRCGICLRVCPLNQSKVYEEKNKRHVDSMRCIKCFECVDKCPEDDCLQVKFLNFTIFKSKFKKL